MCTGGRVSEQDFSYSTRNKTWLCCGSEGIGRSLRWALWSVWYLTKQYFYAYRYIYVCVYIYTYINMKSDLFEGNCNRFAGVLPPCRSSCQSNEDQHFLSDRYRPACLSHLFPGRKAWAGKHAAAFSTDLLLICLTCPRLLLLHVPTSLPVPEVLHPLLLNLLARKQNCTAQGQPKFCCPHPCYSDLLLKTKQKR